MPGPGPDPIRIGLLQCGHIPTDLDPPSGDYPSVFADLLAPHGVALTSHDATAADPPKVDEQDGWLVSGSPDSTYDRLPWIPPMEEFLRPAVAEAAPLVAICFGHQLLAQALGGTVTRAGVGWGVGAHDYSFVERMPWMEPEHTGTVRLIASHQDQVTVLPAPGPRPPPGPPPPSCWRARTTARSPRTPWARALWRSSPTPSSPLPCR